MEVIPRGYGIAWYSPWSMRAYCMRVPFNRIIGAFRNWWLEIRRPCEDDPVMNVYNYAHSIGYSAGKEAGMRLVFETLTDKRRG